MSVLLVSLFTLVGVCGLLVVMTREHVRQAILLGILGLLLALLFFALQAPDVALSELTVGSVALPLMILLAIAKIRMQREAAERADEEER